jgi:2',3'-cyclic-nucleotide 2'-phosphodiesterase/3'-nucleotidase
MAADRPRRDVLEALGATALAGLGAGTATASETLQSDGTTVTVLHDTHVHGRFANAFADGLNVSNYFGVMNDIAEDADNVLRVGNGDDLASSVLSAVFDGLHVVAAFNAGGLDFDTYGNHDFDMGPDVLRERVADSRFTWVSANVRESGDVFAADQGARQYALAEVGDVTVGVTGLITPEAPDITSIGEDTEVLEPAAALEEVVPQMREDGADAVIALSHLAGPVAEDVASEVDGVDAIVGDHAAQVLDEPTVVNDTLLSFAGDQYDYVGELALEVDGSGVVDHAFALHDVGARASRPDPWVKYLQNHYESQLDEQLDVVIGQTTVPLDVRESTVRARESNFGNYIADAIRADVDADAALMNGGGIRTDSLYFEDASEDDPADITQKLVVNVLPFPNNVVELEVAGETLLQALENGVSRVEEQSGRFPQVSGIEYTYDPGAAVGERIVEATLEGEEIDPEGTYELATNDFVAGGGDGYEMFADATRLLPSNEGALLSDLVATTIEAEGTISPTTEGRITRQASDS